ncbi:ATP-dependent DNA ligase [Micromonospora sp. KC606]|uniref:ATP-dependent DNA ligase n=1 Tax=Micromonospora sp. KC606 TaxID=2530379 RepID=UPI00104829E8|nr:ATP-dependent DNA ligase [Micromonospora sp. KC606]TDC80067.1 ATP-dependent DNA ligase [Micromonospora sp. KC606]
MLATPVNAVPEGPGLVHEPKWDGWRALVFREPDGVYIQSRAGRNLTTYFPDITRAIRQTIPPGVVLDGELIAWERGRLNFAQLQRRVTAGRGLFRLAHECPAHYVLFDLLADVGGHVILNLPLSQRRARLERLLADAPHSLTATPQTPDMRQVADWLTHWTVATGIEGVVSKRLDGRYEPGRRGWSKFRTRLVTEAIVGGVTGSISNPDTVLLGRFDRRGRLRYTGRTHPVNVEQRVDLAAQLCPLPSAPRRDVVVHPWPQPLPATWSGQLERPEPLRYAQVEPTVVVEVEVDTAFEHQRWRHRVRYARTRPDLSVYDVPLLLGEDEGYFGEP